MLAHPYLTCVTTCTHALILRAGHLLCQAHEKHIGPLRHPFCAELLFGGGSDGVVSGLEALEELVEGLVDLVGEDRHGRCNVLVVWGRRGLSDGWILFMCPCAVLSPESPENVDSCSSAREGIPKFAANGVYQGSLNGPDDAKWAVETFWSRESREEGSFPPRAQTPIALPNADQSSRPNTTLSRQRTMATILRTKHNEHFQIYCSTNTGMVRMPPVSHSETTFLAWATAFSM